jgi:hypothetical protein
MPLALPKQKLLPALLAVFLLINIFYKQEGGSNPAARIATLAAMSEYGTFETTAYKHWSADWAIRDGRHYSNKAPGPMILAYPIYRAWESLRMPGALSEEERNKWRLAHSEEASYFLALLLQALPMALLLFFAFRLLSTSRAETLALMFLLLALCFGNVSSFFYNSFFGHGLAAWSALAFLIFWEIRRYAWAGFFLGLSVLSDYGSLFLLPAFLAAYFICRKDRPPFKGFLLPFCLGALPTLLVWAYYHQVCFGAPWYLANKFQNPVFQDLQKEEGQLWGVIRLLPNLNTIRNLLWGSSRGLLQTQSWALVALLFLGLRFFRLGRKIPFASLFSLLAFAGLFYMNASFGGWHGGASPGPRYLSAALPLLAFAVYRERKALSRPWILALGLGLVAACLFFAHVFSTSILMTGYPILEEAFQWVWLSDRFPGAILRTLFLLALMAIFPLMAARRGK